MKRSRTGVIKRSIELVPDGYRAELNRFSKADLAEILWDFGVRIIGDDRAHTSIFAEIAKTQEILSHYRNKPARS